MPKSSKAVWNLLMIAVCSIASNLAAELLADPIRLGAKILAHALGIVTP